MKAGNGAQTEWKSKSDNRDRVVSDKLCVISFFIGILLCICFCNFGVCTKWQFLLLLRILRMTQMTVQLCDSILYDRTVMLDRVHFRHSRKAFLNNDSSYYICPLGLPSTWNSSAPTAQSRAPTLTLILLMWRIGWAPNNASRWQMEFNSAFKELTRQFFEPLA